MPLKIKFCPVCGFRFIVPTYQICFDGYAWAVERKEGLPFVVYYKCSLCKGTLVVTPFYSTFVDPWEIKESWSI